MTYDTGPAMRRAGKVLPEDGRSDAAGRREARGRFQPAAALAGALLLAVAVLPTAQAAGRGPALSPAAAGDDASQEPVNYAVAVDQSTSLEEGDIERERDAVAAIAAGEPSSKSRMEVFGFASADTPEQSAIDVVCPARQLDAVGRGKIADCAADLRQRADGEGTGTDFISAVKQGVASLKEAPDPELPRVLFLLTDGHLDVRGSEAYKGLDEVSLQDAAEADLNRALEDAAKAKVQIWPLGFGDRADREQLDSMAAAGYQDGCSENRKARPRAAVVPKAEDVSNALAAAFAATHCLYHEVGPSARPPADLAIRISPLATEGTIVVSKGDREVTAEYYDPNERKITKSGRQGGSEFEFSGRGNATESLRITRPRAGQWRVKLSAPEGHRDKLATISVLWRGAVRSSISVEKASPRAGQRTGVSVRLLTRGDTQLEKRDLKGISVSGELTGKGFDRKVPIEFADGGEGPDEDASDGTFSGTVTVPEEAIGSLLFTAVVESIGLSPDTRSYPTSVSGANPKTEAELHIPRGDVHPGGQVSGSVDLVNHDSVKRTVHLAIVDTSGTGLSISPTEVVIEPGSSRTVGVTVRVGEEAELSSSVAENGTTFVGKVTATEGEAVLDDAPLDITVTPVPSDVEQAWDHWWWQIILGTALLVVIVLALVSFRRGDKERISPRGLVLRLGDAEDREFDLHTVKAGRGAWYGFEIVDAATDSPRIGRSPRGTYAIRRSRNGGAIVRIRRQGERSLPRRGLVTLSDGLILRIAGDDKPSPPVAPSHPQHDEVVPGPPGTAYHDDL